MTDDHVIANITLVDPDGSIEVVRCANGSWRAMLYRAGVPRGFTNGSERDREEIYRLARRRLAPENLRPHDDTCLPPADVVACGANPNVRLCRACIDAYRHGIEPGQTACDERARVTA